MSDVGEAELQLLDSLHKGRQKLQETSAAKIKLPKEGKAVLDRLAAEAVVKDDLDFNHFQSPAQHRLLDAATLTNGAWARCSDKTVAAEVTHLAARGVGNCTSFHKELLDGGIKPTSSSVLWSKTGCVLLGMLLHGIIKREERGTKKLIIKEMLSGAVPCRKERHTGKWMEAASEIA